MLQKAELSGEADSENDLGGSSETMYFIGLDVHKKTISYCVKDAAGRVHQEGKIGSTRCELDEWIKTLPQPRMIAMEATIFTGWIYDHLLPHAEKVKVAHPLMLRAIAAAKRKNDKIDAGKIADCLRCDFLPECHMASTEIRDRRRTLRYFLGRFLGCRRASELFGGHEILFSVVRPRARSTLQSSLLLTRVAPMRLPLCISFS